MGEAPGRMDHPISTLLATILRAAFSGQRRSSYTTLIALRPRQRLGLLQSLFASEDLRPQASGQHVIEVEELGCPAVSETDFESAGLRYGFVPDNADARG
jgi:hypothetical protein